MAEIINPETGAKYKIRNSRKQTKKFKGLWEAHIKSDFKVWLQNKENLKELTEEIGANWILIKHFLIRFLEEKGFYILSKREVEEIKNAHRD